MEKTNNIFNNINRRQESANFVFDGTSVTGNGLISATNFVGNWATQSAPVIKKESYVKLFGLKLWKKMTEISVDEFFSRIGRSKKELKIIDGFVEKYISRIAKAEKMGQTALVEKLKDDIEVVKREALASVCGIKTYITKEQADKLLKEAEKNIEITFIKNFVRPIPDSLLEVKEKLDKENVFDDYVIFHYDPKKENTALTKKEVEKKKDPILFGVIKGSTNFYFVGDWIDEYCNLTLKEAVAIIEDQGKKLTPDK